MRIYQRTFVLLLLFFCYQNVWAMPLKIVAAENFYGVMAKQIGGPYVTVTSILQNPNQDPHLFTVNPSTAKALAQADLVVYNGAGYDGWIEKLLAANKKSPRAVIVVANLLNEKIIDNPHIWYNPATMPLYVKTLSAQLQVFDPVHAPYFQAQVKLFEKHFLLLQTWINIFRTHYLQTPIIATEPVFNDMAEALALKIYGQDLQQKIMNNTEPSAREISDFEYKLMHNQVKVLIYNKQVKNPLTERLQQIARKNNIPIVGITETQPAHTDYIHWMVLQLSDLQSALQRSNF